jgi:purine-binding chemotaxis protein CheW
VATNQLNDGEEQVVVFDLAGENYGIDISHVQEIIRRPAITTVPRAPEYVEGVVNLRGRVIPVISLRGRFGLAGAEADRASRIIVLEVSGNTIGAAVDAVTEVLRVPASTVEPPGATLTGPEAAHLRGIAKLEERLIILLRLDRIVEMDEARDAVAA